MDIKINISQKFEWIRKKSSIIKALVSVFGLICWLFKGWISLDLTGGFITLALVFGFSNILFEMIFGNYFDGKHDGIREVINSVEQMIKDKEAFEKKFITDEILNAGFKKNAES